MAEILIKAPREGIAQSPHVGYGDVRNLDISSIPGIVRLNNITAKKSSTTVVTLPQWIVKNPATPAEVYALDSAGKVYKSADSGASWALMTGFTAGGTGQGMAIWKNYLFVARATAIDICGDGTATGITNANWSNSWAGLTLTTDALWHPMFVSKNDGNLYIGAGKFISSVLEVSGQTFAPGTGATYTATAEALDLPANYRVKCLEELGNNLMIGTWQGTNVYDLRIADIFPWDRSATSFGQPINMEENGVHAMKNIGNSLVVLAGTDGKIYLCDGVNSTMIGQIPDSVSDLGGGKNIAWYPGAIANYKGKIFFGVSGNGTDAIGGMGVYSLLRTSKGNILTHEHTISTATDGTSYVVKIGAILPVTRDNLLIGWYDATPTASYGIDAITTTSFSSSYVGYFESPFYTVGSLLQQKTPTEIEFNLVRPLRTGEGIRLAYRTDITATYTTIVTPTFTTDGAVVSVNTIYEFPPCEQIQFKVSFLGTTTTTPELKNISIRW